MYYKVIMQIAVVFSIFVIFNCNNSINPDDSSLFPSGVTKLILPPQNVIAQVAASDEKNFITISWDPVDNVQHYKVYKKIEDTQYTEISTLIDAPEFSYREYEWNQSIIYAVKSENSGEYSDYSAGSLPVMLSLNDVLTPATPQVKSFTIPNGIRINWAGSGVSEVSYILYRYDSPTGGNEKIFNPGTALTYDDTNDITFGQFYYYKLALKKDGIIYSRSKYAYGVASDILKDNFDNNNDESQTATHLDIDDQITASIYFYQDNVLNTLQDIDWYSVMVPANSSIYVKFDFIENLNVNDLVFTQEGKTPESIDLNDFNLINDDNLDKYIKFQVSFDTSKKNYKIGTYSITLN